MHALSIDEGLVDLSGTDRLFGPPLKTADAIIRRVESELGLPSSGGLSTSKVVAKIAATLAKPHGLVYVPAGSEKDFLAPLAVEMIPGVGPKTHKALNQKGIKTIGDLLRRDELAARYLDLEASERGHRHDHSIGNETTLEQPARTVAQMEKVLWELVEEVGARLRREKLFARCLTVKIRYPNFHTDDALAHPGVADLLRQGNFLGRKRVAAAKSPARRRRAAIGRERQRAAKPRLAGAAV